MTLPSALKIGILVDFKINQDFIAKVLCINKEEPELQCNGKCHLKKQLKKLETPIEQDAPVQKTNQFELTFIAIRNDVNLHHNADFLKDKSQFSKIDHLFIDGYIAEIFHPPRTSFIS
jgi:hypothetical protein